MTMASSDAGEADRQRDAHAVEDGREHVAALVVGAEQDSRTTPSLLQTGGRRLSVIDSEAGSNGLCGAISGASERRGDQHHA